jgi:hypothetical protein
MYEVGRVYIWQNQVGALESLNGSETTVIEKGAYALSDETQKIIFAWKTDSMAINPRTSKLSTVYAVRG